MKFDCDKCGECCRNVNLSEIYADLDSGNGICKYLVGNLCSIYENRPLKCRIDECYYEYFSKEMTMEEYYEKNYEMCNILKNHKKEE